jgi:L-iditol 2-dehydrogenase
MPASIPLTTAAVLYGAQDLRIEHRFQPPPPPGHAQVRVVTTTLCGSDGPSSRRLSPSLSLTDCLPAPAVHYYASGANGAFTLQHPMCLGHEAAGIITAVAPDAPPEFQIGTRVAIECGLPCAPRSAATPAAAPDAQHSPTSCARCSEGRYNLCPAMRFCSSAKTAPHLDGTLQTLINHPTAWLHPLPEAVTYDQAALAEPLAVVLHAARRAALARAHSVLVFGAGAVGLLACALARAEGASRVVCVDVNQARLDFAKRHGFVDSVFNSTPEPAPTAPTTPTTPTSQLPFQDEMDRARATADRILAHAQLDELADGFDIVFECTGAVPCIQAGIYVCLFHPFHPSFHPFLLFLLFLLLLPFSSFPSPPSLPFPSFPFPSLPSRLFLFLFLFLPTPHPILFALACPSRDR